MEFLSKFDILCQSQKYRQASSCIVCSSIFIYARLTSRNKQCENGWGAPILKIGTRWRLLVGIKLTRAEGLVKTIKRRTDWHCLMGRAVGTAPRTPRPGGAPAMSRGPASVAILLLFYFFNFENYYLYFHYQMPRAAGWNRGGGINSTILATLCCTKAFSNLQAWKRK